MTLEEIASALAYFRPGAVRLNPGAHPRDIDRAESELAVRFPPALRRALEAFNGGYLLSEPLHGVPPVHSSLDLLAVTRQARHLWGPMGWQHGYVHVGSDGGGNAYALLLDRTDDRGESPVGLFDAGTLQVVEIVASTYLHFVWFLAHDVQWDHAPDGRPVARQAIVWTANSVIIRPDALSPWRFNEAWMIANDPGLARWR